MAAYLFPSLRKIRNTTTEEEEGAAGENTEPWIWEETENGAKYVTSQKSGDGQSRLFAQPGLRSTAEKAGCPSQLRHRPGCSLGKVTGSAFHTQEKHSLYPFVQQIFPECLLGSEMVLGDTKDVKEGPALCLRTQAGGNAGGGGRAGSLGGRKGTCKAEDVGETRSRRLGPGAPGEWKERRAGAPAGQTQTPGGPWSLSGSPQTPGKSPRHAGGGRCGHTP